MKTITSAKRNFSVALFVIIVSAFNMSTKAFPPCANFGEAQLSNGFVEKIDINSNGCRAFVSAATSNITTNPLCPVDEGRLFTNGIEVGLHKEDVCNAKIGEILSGILVDNGVVISIE